MFQPPLVPDDLDVPAFKAFGTFALVALDMDRAEEDFALVDANRAHLAGTFGPANPWQQGVDLRMNRADVAWHEVEFRCRTSFAYWIAESAAPAAPPYRLHLHHPQPPRGRRLRRLFLAGQILRRRHRACQSHDRKLAA